MIRKAKVSDVQKMQKLINYYAELKEMLPRSLNELYEEIQDFFVYESHTGKAGQDKKKILGCCELHIIWEDLAEIRSLAVDPEYLNRGIGKQLVQQALNQAKNLAVKKVFVLTFKPAYFKQFRFREIPRNKLPHKIWSQCIRCTLFPDCKEIALITSIK